jgi:hypothetical protein
MDRVAALAAVVGQAVVAVMVEDMEDDNSRV